MIRPPFSLWREQASLFAEREREADNSGVRESEPCDYLHYIFNVCVKSTDGSHPAAKVVFTRLDDFPSYFLYFKC